MSSSNSDNRQGTSTSVLEAASSRLALRRKLRHFFDRAAHLSIATGGISVIITILLIFLYLFYEVIPLFESAEIDQIGEFRLSQASAGTTLHLAIEEQAEIGMRLTDDGVVSFFSLDTGELLSRNPITLPASTSISSFALDTEESGIFALGLNTGEVVVAAHQYRTRFQGEDNTRVITPVLEFPFGEEPFQLFSGTEISKLSIRTRNDSMLLAGAETNGSINLLRASKQTSLFAAFDDNSASSFDIETAEVDLIAAGTAQLLIEGDRRWLIAIGSNGLVRILDMNAAFAGNLDAFEFESFLTENGDVITEIDFLLGGISLLVADNSGTISQWFLTRDGDRNELSQVRTFATAGQPIDALTVEQRRKNFVTADSAGNINIFNTTARRAVFTENLGIGSSRAIAISPRGDALLVEAQSGEFTFWEVHNEHPEVSWSALWDRVWYEGYSDPEFIWQSSAATNEFEPKYSLVPLSFGTLKAAFYAMLLAAPLAICGAIYTGYFMAPMMRRKVKPLIELMEALPTVVLGFLAGLWLAPFVESNLLGIFSILVLLPLGIILASFAWLFLPKEIRHSIPDGWEAAMLMPVILLFGYLSFVIAGPLELMFFGGDIRFWLTNDMGIAYDQRNAMVVGFAMGFAVIPTVFSIAEDAIFTVPRHLTFGSLALGATPWQSLYRVVLPTASPGIFSALMIGMGRAVGETMIVLMATGNTPIMDINIFEGMRTLAANIAVEIPESEVDSTHYRILFLAALVLFTFTFVINTIAEVVRQRLRNRYSTI